MAENNDENRQKLAEVVVDTWDMDTLVEFAVDKLVEVYKNDDIAFQKDWLEIKGEQ